MLPYRSSTWPVNGCLASWRVLVTERNPAPKKAERSKSSSGAVERDRDLLEIPPHFAEGICLDAEPLDRSRAVDLHRHPIAALQAGRHQGDAEIGAAQNQRFQDLPARGWPASRSPCGCRSGRRRAPGPPPAGRRAMPVPGAGAVLLLQRVSQQFLLLHQNSRCLGVRGNGITSRMLVTPVTIMRNRSKPSPKPACGTVPKRRRSRYHQ